MAARTASGEASERGASIRGLLRASMSGPLPLSMRRRPRAGRLRVLVPSIVLLLAAAPASAQQGIIVVDDERHDFGVIQAGAVARHVFTISNTGDVPFNLIAVRPSCGCTVPEWTTDPIEPGEHGEIVAEFYSEGLSGPFEKSISVESTASPSTVILYIEGRVEPRFSAAGDTLGGLVFYGFRTALPVVRQGDPLSHPIRIRNISDQPVEISEAHTDAHYVSADFPKSAISPGEFVEVNVSFVTSEMRRGPFIHRIDFVTTDPRIPMKEIRLTGLIK